MLTHAKLMLYLSTLLVMAECLLTYHRQTALPSTCAELSDSFHHPVHQPPCPPVHPYIRTDTQLLYTPIALVAVKFIVDSSSGNSAWPGRKEELAVMHLLRKDVAVRVRGALARIIKLHVE